MHHSFAGVLNFECPDYQVLLWCKTFASCLMKCALIRRVHYNIALVSTPRNTNGLVAKCFVFWIYVSNLISQKWKACKIKCYQNFNFANTFHPFKKLLQGVPI